MRHSLFVALLGTLVSAAPVLAQTPISGIVLDSATSAPLGGVSVVDVDRHETARTDRNGRFTLPCTGATTLLFQKVGYAPARREAAGCGAELKVELSTRAEVLAPVNVVALPERPVIERPQSVTTLTRHELNRSTGLFLRESLNLTPGVRFQSRTMAGGQTLTIRGYGAGSNASNFIGSGYKAYYNGIPITDAEGQTILDDVDFASLGSVQVIRGPASSLYGGGIGGVVELNTALPSERGTTLALETLGGSYGLFRSTARVGHASEGATTLLSYGHQNYDSYRIHSASKKDFGTFLGEFRPSDRQTVSTFVSYANSRDQRAGELDSLQFFREENTGEPPYLSNDARQEIESFRVGVTDRYRLSDRLETAATAFYTGSTRTDIYAVGLNSSADQTFGARAVLNAAASLGALPLRGTTGGEFEKTNGSGQGYRLWDGVLGEQRSDLATSTMQYSLFTQWEAQLPADFTLTAGVSANSIEYAITDRMASSANPDHQSSSGRKVFDPVFTPRVALMKLLGPDASIYVDVSQGYSPPTASDAVIPFTGQPNEALEPERATQYEIGTKGRLIDGRLSYQLALFDLRVHDKLSSASVFDAEGSRLYSYTVNAGDQDDRGLELALSYALVDDPASTLSLVRPFLSYTYSDFVYHDFRSDAGDQASGVDYSGNKVVGVAPNVFNAGLDAALRSGAYGNVTLHHTDGMPISYDNAHHAPGFSLLNAKVGFSHDVASRLRLDAFVGGHNLLGSRYYTQVFLNHKFDSPNPHMYLPGPYTATFYAGVNLGYRP